jgi:hypothetical protein
MNTFIGCNAATLVQSHGIIYCITASCLATVAPLFSSDALSASTTSALEL